MFDTTADGGTAFVIETTQANDGTLTTFDQLLARQGTTLTALDLCAEGGLAERQRTTTAAEPTTVALSQGERWLAVTHRDSPTSPAGLVMHEITDAVVGDANTVSLPADLVAGSDEVTYAGWSPDGTMLAIAVRDSRQLGFFQWTGDELLQVGNLVPIDEGTFGGVWSPDSRFFYTNNVRGASRPELPSDPAELISTLQTVQVAPVDGPQPAHSVIQTTPTTIFTEGVAASPDGRLFAAVSMQTTALPTSNALFNPTSPSRRTRTHLIEPSARSTSGT